MILVLFVGGLTVLALIVAAGIVVASLACVIDVVRFAADRSGK